MSMRKFITDILGNTVLITPQFYNKGGYSFDEIENVLTNPAYIIEVRGKALYFFSPFDFGKKVLLEVVLMDNCYSIVGLVNNPSKEYTMQLLSKGGLVHITDHV